MIFLAKLIKGWEDLVGLESETHRLDINVEVGNGWIVPKKETEESLGDY